MVSYSFFYYQLIICVLFFCFYYSVVLPQGKLEERKPFMLLFDDVAIQYILSAAQ